MGSDAAILASSAIIGGGLTLAAVGAVATGNIPGSALIVGSGAVAVGFAFGDLAANIIWRQGVESDFENQFGEAGHFEGSESIVGFQENPDLYIHPDYCWEMTSNFTVEEDDKNYIVQPAPVELEVPEVTLTYTLSDGTILSGVTEVSPPLWPQWRPLA